MHALNPAVNLRADYNARYYSMPPPPEGANPQWVRVFTSLHALFKALAEHEGMARNNQQTYDTPAIDKNAQYFSWDFTARTFNYILRTDPELVNRTEDEKEAWDDTCSRSRLITSLVLDEIPGRLADMVELTYPGYNPGGQPEMGPQVIEAARELSAAAYDATPDPA